MKPLGLLREFHQPSRQAHSKNRMGQGHAIPRVRSKIQTPICCPLLLNRLNAIWFQDSIKPIAAREKMEMLA
jgi:hypothetical protein